MVKRQTVWLSTMMVLSLMVIGYYTLGTPTAQPQGQKANTGIQTTVQGSGINSPVGGNTTSSRTAVTTNAAAASQPSDWFIKLAYDQNNLQEQTTQQLQGEIANPRVSSAAVTTAYNELTALQTQTAGANKVHDMLLGLHYPDSIVLYEPHGRIQVYVESASLTPEAAVEIINLVSQALGVQSNLITVTPHV